MERKCFQCNRKGKVLYGYVICDSCKSKLGLYTDKWIDKHDSPKFRKDVDRRLEILEQDYVKKRIKLLHIKNRLRLK